MTNLSNGFNNVVESGWLTIEELVAQQPSTLAAVWRNQQLETENPEVINNLINLIYNSSDEGRLKVAAQRLGEIQTESRDVIDALVHLLGKTKDEETRWTAVETLWAIAPNNPVCGVRRIKDLGIEIGGHSVGLMVAILPKLDNKVAVLTRLYPMNSVCLPPKLKLIILEDTGETFLEAQAREIDNYIQLKFSGWRGDWFSVQVALDDAQVTEGFVI